MTSNDLNIQCSQGHRLRIQAMVPPIRTKRSQAFQIKHYRLYENSFNRRRTVTSQVTTYGNELSVYIHIWQIRDVTNRQLFALGL